MEGSGEAIGTAAGPAPGPAAGRRPRARPRRRRAWLISPEGFRELRHSCLLRNQKAAAAYLGVCVRTIRHWDSGRCRVPWSVVRLLRLLRAGQLGGLLDGWDGWTIWRDRLVSPDGRIFRERDMRQLWLTLTQAELFREGYDKATAPAFGGTDAAALVHGGAERLEGASQGRPTGAAPCVTVRRPHGAVKSRQHADDSAAEPLAPTKHPAP